MAKKDELGPRAKELFAIHHLGMDEISTRLGISVRTLHNWKKEDQWEVLKSELGGGEGNLHSDLFQLAAVMSRKIKQDMEEGREIHPSRLYALGKLIESTQKSKAYEKDEIRETTAERPRLSQDDLMQALQKALREFEK